MRLFTDGKGEGWLIRPLLMKLKGSNGGLYIYVDDHGPPLLLIWTQAQFFIYIYVYMLHNWIASLMIWMPSEFGASQHLLGSSPNVLFFWKSKESGLNQLSSIVFFLAATPMRKNIPWPQFQPAATLASNEAHGIDDWRRGTDQGGRRMCHRHLSMLNLKSPESHLMWR